MVFGEALLDGDLHPVARVRVHVGQRQQVRGPHKEVAVERVDGQTCRGKLSAGWSNMAWTDYQK